MYRIAQTQHRTAVTVSKDEVLKQLRHRLTLAEKRVVKWKTELDDFDKNRAAREAEQRKKDKAWLKTVMKAVNAGTAEVRVHDSHRPDSYVFQLLFKNAADAPEREVDSSRERDKWQIQDGLRKAKRDVRQLKGAIRLVQLATDETIQVLATDVGMNIMGTQLSYDPYEDDDEDDEL